MVKWKKVLSELNELEFYFLSKFVDEDCDIDCDDQVCEFNFLTFVEVNTEIELSIGLQLKPKLDSILTQIIPSTALKAKGAVFSIVFFVHTSSPVLIDQDNSIQCPNCGSNYLHPGIPQSDFEEITYGSQVKMHLPFYCECCPSHLTLTTEHHKGITSMYWSYQKTQV